MNAFAPSLYICQRLCKIETTRITARAANIDGVLGGKTSIAALVPELEPLAERRLGQEGATSCPP